MDDTRPLAFSYLRFSTPEQQRGDSYRRQRNKAVEYAAKNNLRLDTRSYEDLGVSAYRGANRLSGALGQLLEAVKKGRVPRGSYLLVENLDRMSREKPRKALRALEDVCEAGIKVVTLTDGKVYDETALDDTMGLMYALVGMMRSHEESLRKSNLHEENWRKKRLDAEGPRRKPMTALAPAWLKLTPDRQRYEMIPERVKVVRQIFASYLSGTGPHSIAAQLNADGVRPFGRARLWHRSYVAKILDNRSVLGEATPHIITYDDGGKKVRQPLAPITDYYPAVVPLEEFIRAIAMRTAKRSPSSHGKARSVSHLLAGLAKCPRCRGAMVRVSKGSGPKAGVPRLVCYRARTNAGCSQRSVRVDRVEEAVRGCLERLALAGHPGTSATVTAAFELAQQQRAKKVELQAKLARLIDLVNAVDDTGSLSPPLEASFPTIAREVRKYERQLQEIAAWEMEQSRRLAEHSPASMEGRLEDLRLAVTSEELDVVRVNALLRQIMSRVVVNYDKGEIAFHWHGTGVTRLPCTDL